MAVASLRREVRTLGTDDPADLVAKALLLWCPGCEGAGLNGLHRVVVEAGPAHDGGPLWTWDGNLDAPTVSPSLLCTSTWPGGEMRCHSFIEAGQWRYLGDCTHALAGQLVPLPDLPDWVPHD